MAGGRPTKFPDKHLSAVKKLVLMGATDNDIAEAFDVTPQTVSNWKKQKPEFFESLMDWKLEADTRIEKSLFQRAEGYTHKETKVASVNGKITDQIDVDRHYPPDATSMIFWLKNRKPQQWRDRPEGSEEKDSPPIDIHFSIQSGRKDAES